MSVSMSASTGYKKSPSNLEFFLTPIGANLLSAIREVLPPEWMLLDVLAYSLEKLIHLTHTTNWDRIPPEKNIILGVRTSNVWWGPVFADEGMYHTVTESIRIPPQFSLRLVDLEKNVPYSGDKRCEAFRHVLLFALYLFSEECEEGVFEHLH